MVGDEPSLNYIRYDEIDDVVASTELLSLITPLLAAEPGLWKWAIIAAQNGLQGAIVCALHDGMGVSVLNDKSARAVLNWHQEREGPYPEERLADFPTLLKRFCRKYPSVRAPTWQVRDLHRLHRHFRNNFEHFTPKSWSIEFAGLPRIVATPVDFIKMAMQLEPVKNRLTEIRLNRLRDNLVKTHDAMRSLSWIAGSQPYAATKD